MATSTDWKRANTNWLHDARWGVFMHYLAELHLPKEALDTAGGITLWNRLVDEFDAAGLAKQIKTTGAGYFFLTLGQNSGYYCAPNATYDRIVRTPTQPPFAARPGGGSGRGA